MQEGSSDGLERSTTKTARPVLIRSQNRRVSRLANHQLGLYLHPPFRRLLLADDSTSINRLSKTPSIDSCVHLPESNRTLRDGSFGVGFSLALRARLRSHRPSGTFQTRFSSGREENLKMERDFAAKHGKINGLHLAPNLEAPFSPGLNGAKLRGIWGILLPRRPEGL